MIRDYVSRDYLRRYEHKALSWALRRYAEYLDDDEWYHGEFKITQYDAAQARSRWPYFDELSGNAQRIWLENSDLEPISVDTHSNVVTNGQLNYIVDEIDPNQTPTDLTASHLALGNDDSSFSVSDTTMNNELYRETVDSSTDNGNELVISTTIGSGEANGNTYKEIGLFTASSGGTMFNHAHITDLEKDSNVTAVIEVTLTYTNP